MLAPLSALFLVASRYIAFSFHLLQPTLKLGNLPNRLSQPAGFIGCQ